MSSATRSITLLVDVKYPSLGGSAARLRGISEPGERELVADPAGAREVRAPLPDGRADADALVDKIKAARHFNQGFATVEYLVVGAGRHEAPPRAGRRGRSRRVRERGAGQARHAEGDGDAAPAAAVRPPLLVRRLFGRLLQLPVVGNDGRRHLGGVRGTGNPFDRKIADGFRTFLLSTGNETDRAEAYRKFRGRDPDVEALLKRRGFPIN